MESSSSLEQILQDAKLHRQLNSLIVAHLRDNNLTQAATAVASATMTRHHLTSSLSSLLSAVQDTKGSSKSFPKHETRHLSEYKNIARCARFSPDGKFVATGSANTSIKLFEVCHKQIASFLTF